MNKKIYIIPSIKIREVEGSTLLDGSGIHNEYSDDDQKAKGATPDFSTSESTTSGSGSSIWDEE